MKNMRNMRKKETVTEAENEVKSEKQEKQKDHDKRRKNFIMFSIAMCGMLEGILLGKLNYLEIDRMLILLFFSILYAMIFLVGIEFYQIQQDWFYEKILNNGNIAVWFAGFSMAAVLFGCLPEYVRPVLLFSLGMTMITNSFFGMISGIFHVAIYAICGQENAYILLCYILLLIGGCITVSILEKKESFYWEAIFLFLYTFSSILIFSYVQTGQLKGNVLIYGICNGIFSSIGAISFFQILHKYQHSIQTKRMQKILKENFQLVQAVKNFSQIDYYHARKVAEITRGCALKLEADPDITAAGGFYYRLGRMVGEPYVENGVALAKSNLLPKAVVEILKEYNGEKELPSTIESAIVHIVDSVVTKFDVLDKKTLSSSWNQDMLVYQTLNENSAAGLYDKSGLSMNMFIKIRDYLIKEAELF